MSYSLIGFIRLKHSNVGPAGVGGKHSAQHLPFLWSSLPQLSHPQLLLCLCLGPLLWLHLCFLLTCWQPVLSHGPEPSPVTFRLTNPLCWRHPLTWSGVVHLIPPELTLAPALVRSDQPCLSAVDQQRIKDEDSTFLVHWPLLKINMLRFCGNNR